MKIKIEIGEAHYSPLGVKLFPIYKRTAYDLGIQIFVTEEQMLDLKSRLEHTWLVAKEYEKALKNASES